MFNNAFSAKFSQLPLLWLAFSFAGGILAAKNISINWQIWLALALIGAAFSLVNFRLTAENRLILLAFFALGGFYFQTVEGSVAPNRIKRIYDEKRIASGDPVEIEGVLRGKPELAFDGFSLILRAEKIVYKNEEFDVSGNLKLFASTSDLADKNEYGALDLRYGSKIRVACRLQRDESFLNPGVFSRLEILEQQNLDATALIKSPLLVEKIGDEEVFTPLAWIYEQRQNLIVEFKEKFSPQTAGIMIASLLGNKNFLDRQTAELFREGGTFHVLVISGLHITFIGGLVLLFLRFFTKRRIWHFLLASAILWAYSLAVGAEVPVVRASIMFTALLFSQVVYRHANLLNSLGLCTLILLVWRPHDLFSSSFQLTFASVAAIIVFAFPLIETLRKIGGWTPTTENPFPANVPKWLKGFCEMLYWREDVWEIERKRQIWSANLFKTPFLPKLQNSFWQPFVAYLFEGVLVSVIVQLCLLPFLIVYFHRVSFASVWLNIWVGFFIALESFSAVIALFLAQFSEIAALPLIKLTEIFNFLLLAVPNIFVANDFASVRVPVYSGALKTIYFLYFAPITIFAVFLYRWRPFELNFDSAKQLNFRRRLLKVSGLIFALLLFTQIFHPFSVPRADGRLRIDFLDVGQGDAAFVTFPNGETLLIDGGGKINFQKRDTPGDDADAAEDFEPDARTIGEAVVSEFLWEKGYAQIDYILATHADTDHIQGLIDVAKNFRVRAAFFGRTPLKDADFIELKEVLEKKNVPSVVLSRGDFLEFGGATVEVLFPEKDESETAISDNNHSLVLRISFGTKKFLLTGDIERQTESFLARNPPLLQADVVKAAHHGSRTSSTEEFVDATRAGYVIIPVGKTSQFGHPHKEIVERWKNAGAKIYQTGDQGTVTISTDGKDFEIQTFRQ